MFVREELAKPFRILEDNRVYSMDRLLDIAKWPEARAITFYTIIDPDVDTAITVKVVGNDVPDPGGGIVNLGDGQISTPNKYNKLVFSINIASAPFPFYGVTFTAGPAPSKGLCSAFADIWW